MVRKNSKTMKNKWTRCLGIATITLASLISSGCSLFGDHDDDSTAPIHPSLQHTSSSTRGNQVRNASYRPQKSSTRSANKLASNSAQDTIPDASEVDLSF